ncbi:MAG: ATPase [Lachnospiraceae bacterium]|nr:ATPase [Lachnospiraceae bacterium]
MLVNLISLFLFVLTIALPVAFYYAVSDKSKTAAKHSLLGNVISFSLVFAGSSIFLFANTASAAESIDLSTVPLSVGLGFIGAALAVGLGSIGCGIAVANAASAALSAVSEGSPFGTALIFVALGEGVAIYGFLIAFLILSKLPALV